ncbi:MAG TPA: DUF2339 domain-containing protein [Armatimonadota bacterium]|jgi:hypothetical protein
MLILFLLVVAILLIYLFTKIAHLSERLNAVENQLFSPQRENVRAQQQASPQPESFTAPPAATRPLEKPPVTVRTPAPHVVPQQTVSNYTEAPVNPLVPPPPPTPESGTLTAFRTKIEKDMEAYAAISTVPERAPITPPSRTREEWEVLIGGNLFNRIGAVALVIAVALFLKYAYDSGWIHPNPTVRVCMGALAGMALLWGGAWSNRKALPIFAQGLVGAGIGTLYLSVYAAYGFFQLVPLSIALWGMFVVTLVAFWQALKYDAMVIAILGWIGGVLTPLLLRSDMAFTHGGVNFFTYLIFLNAGLLALQWKKRAWVALEPLTLIGSYCLYFYWFAAHAPIKTLLPLPFVLLYWAMFLAIDLERGVSRKDRVTKVARLALFALNALGFGVAAYLLFDPRHHALLVPFFFTVAVGYASVGLLLASYKPRALLAVMRYLLAGVAFLVLATWEQFHGFTLVIVWTIEALALLWCGLHWQRSYIWRAALSIMTAAFVRLLLTDGALAYVPLNQYIPVLNLRFLAFLVLALVCAASALLCQRKSDRVDESVPMALHYGWTMLLFTLMTTEINDTFRRYWSSNTAAGAHPYVAARYMIMAVSWTLYSLPLVWWGMRKRLHPMVYSGFVALGVGVLFIAVRGIGYDPLRNFLPILNLRAIPFLMVIVGLTVQARWLYRQRDTHTWIVPLVNFVQVIAALLLFEVLTVETIDTVQQRVLLAGADASRACWQFAQMTCLPVVWTLYATALLYYMRWRNSPVSLVVCALAAQLLALVTLAGTGISHSPLAWYIPMVNIRALPFVLVMAGLLVQAVYLRRMSAVFPWLYNWSHAWKVCVVLLGGELLTVEIIDSFSKYAGTANGLPDSMSFMQSMVLPMIWAVYALPVVWIGYRKQLFGVIASGFAIMTLAVCVLALAGRTFVPTTDFTLLTNVRAAAFVVVLIAFGVQLHWLWLRRWEYAWARPLFDPMRVVMALLLFELCTFETLDYFARLLAIGPIGVTRRLADLTQTALSVVWLLYSMSLMAFGIWRQLRVLRVLALIVFLVSIFKIGIYFILLPNRLYQSISFAGLALTLLLTSYLYNRFKAIVLAPPPEEAPQPTCPIP